jgi:hypothetical protein
MRSKDIRIGERYIACHCGMTIVVKVDSIFQPSKIGETTHIIATNQATGQRISFSSSLGIMRPAGPYINEVKNTSDLYIEQIAVPEPGVRYPLDRSGPLLKFTSITIGRRSMLTGTMAARSC